MKSTLLLLLLCLPGYKQNPLDGLIGNWRLEKVESNGKTILPTNHFSKYKDYSLSISQNEFNYNFDVNECKRTIISIDDKEITLDKICQCTEVCCNGHFDSIVHYIDYNGTYELHDSLLVITNNKGKEYLKRE